jgi:hypothetical protein
MSSGAFLFRFSLGMAAGVGAVALALSWGTGTAQPRGAVLGVEAVRSPVEARLRHIASALAGKRVEVRCWSRADWSPLLREQRPALSPDAIGFAGIGGRRINLGPEVCGALADLAYDRGQPANEGPRLRLATAVVTLTHEPQHSKGIADEALAECLAIQLAPRTAMMLGVSRPYSAVLMRTYWSHYDQEPTAYRSPACRKGGALDLASADSIWP